MEDLYYVWRNEDGDLFVRGPEDFEEWVRDEKEATQLLRELITSDDGGSINCDDCGRLRPCWKSELWDPQPIICVDCAQDRWDWKGSPGSGTGPSVHPWPKGYVR